MVSTAFTIWCGALSTEQHSLGEANWRSSWDAPCRVRAPAPFARNAPRQTNHGKSGANMPGENEDLNHGVILVRVPPGKWLEFTRRSSSNLKLSDQAARSIG